MIAALLALLALQARPEPLPPVLLRGAHVVSPDRDGISLLVRDGRIARMAPNLEAPEGARVVDLPKGAWIVPGFVDAHGHLGSAFEVEESTESVTPRLRAVDGFAARHPDVLDARGSGATHAAVAPGNGNVVGGRIGLVRLHGRRFDLALVSSSAGLKASLGPEAVRRDREPTSAAGALGVLRAALGSPDCRDGLVWIHAPGVRESLAALDLLGSSGRSGVLLHAPPSEDLLEALRKRPVPVALGPLLPTDRRSTLEWPGRLARAGVPVIFASDAPRSGPGALRFSAVLAMQYGMPREAALASLGARPAELFGLAPHVEEGAPARFAVWSGDPLDLTSVPLRVFIDGEETWSRP
jgi:imidazolonepropionase-like amidohydrolase